MQIEVQLNQQQSEIVNKLRTEEGLDGSDEQVVKSAFLDYVSSKLERKPVSSSAGESSADELPEVSYGNIREEMRLEPVTGKALPVYEGEILRIIQEEGGQCVDFNAFNLYDYKERLDVGRTRAYNGLFPKQGGFVYTASPRDRAMFEILVMPETCRAETLGARCNAVLFERLYGFSIHTNCQDTLAAAIGEYGLTPDDVHDSFNMWMNTEVDEEGHMVLHENTGKKGDYVDLLAIMDTLSVPIVCGSGDVMTTSNFSLKPIRIQVYEATDESRARAKAAQEQHNSFRNNRTVDQFKVAEIKADRPLERDPDYQPEWVNYPLKLTPLAIDLSDEEYEAVDQARKNDLAPEGDDAAIIRSCAMQRYLQLRSSRDPSVQFVSADA